VSDRTAATERRERIRSKVEEKLRPLTLPNFITLFRMAITPFFVLAVNDGDFRLALWILIVGGITDAVDGWLARSFTRARSRRVPRPDRRQAAADGRLRLADDPARPAGRDPALARDHGPVPDFSIVIVAVILYAVEGVHRFPPSVLARPRPSCTC